MNRKATTTSQAFWIGLGLLYLATLICIGWLAYTDNLPAYLGAIPHYDTIGHFVIYGIATYLGQRIFQRSAWRLGKFSIPLFPLGFGIVTVVEEGLQSLSPVRDFSALDMFMSLVGLGFGYWLARRHGSEPRSTR